MDGVLEMEGVDLDSFFPSNRPLRDGSMSRASRISLEACSPVKLEDVHTPESRGFLEASKFQTRFGGDQETACGNAEISDRKVDSFILAGPRESGLTSLLFQLAYNRAELFGRSGRVIFFGQEEKLRERPPSVFACSGSPTKVWNRDEKYLRLIDFKFVNRLDDLIQSLSKLHLLSTAVHTVLIDDLDTLCSTRDRSADEKDFDRAQADKAAMAMVLALLKDGCNGLSCKFRLKYPVVYGASLKWSQHSLHTLLLRTRLWISQSYFVSNGNKGLPAISQESHYNLLTRNPHEDSVVPVAEFNLRMLKKMNHYPLEETSTESHSALLLNDCRAFSLRTDSHLVVFDRLPEQDSHMQDLCKLATAGAK